MCLFSSSSLSLERPVSVNMIWCDLKDSVVRPVFCVMEVISVLRLHVVSSPVFVEVSPECLGWRHAPRSAPTSLYLHPPPEYHLLFLLFLTSSLPPPDSITSPIFGTLSSFSFLFPCSYLASSRPTSFPVSSSSSHRLTFVFCFSINIQNKHKLPNGFLLEEICWVIEIYRNLDSRWNLKMLWSSHPLDLKLLVHFFRKWSLGNLLFPRLSNVRLNVSEGLNSIRLMFENWLNVLF